MKAVRSLFSRVYTEANINTVVEYADLEALDISKLDQPGGKQALAEQLLSFINKNGPQQNLPTLSDGDRSD